MWKTYQSISRAQETEYSSAYSSHRWQQGVQRGNETLMVFGVCKEAKLLAEKQLANDVESVTAM